MNNNKTIIIAEVGECFNGNIDQASQLIQVAFNAGCDYVKFQILDTANVSDDDPEKKWFEKVTISYSELKFLINQCSKVGINFLATPENKKMAELMKSLNLNCAKIASTCLEDAILISYIAKNFDTVFVSTGMASLEEVAEIRKNLVDVKNLYIMHCISEYPTGPLLEQRGLKALSEKDVHIRMMIILKENFPECKIGYSDHTDGILAPIVAVSAGAEVIEKHITLDKKTPIENYYSNKEYLGTDHILSLEPDELKEMVRVIRHIEKMLGDNNWNRSDGEKTLMHFLRKRFRNA